MTPLDLLRDAGVDLRSEGHEHCRPGWVILRRRRFYGSRFP